jgi:hypothetical protein
LLAAGLDGIRASFDMINPGFRARIRTTGTRLQRLLRGLNQAEKAEAWKSRLGELGL